MNELRINYPSYEPDRYSTYGDNDIRCRLPVRGYEGYIPLVCAISGLDYITCNYNRRSIPYTFGNIVQSSLSGYWSDTSLRRSRTGLMFSSGLGYLTRLSINRNVHFCYMFVIKESMADVQKDVYNESKTLLTDHIQLWYDLYELWKSPTLHQECKEKILTPTANSGIRTYTGDASIHSIFLQAHQIANTLLEFEELKTSLIKEALQ